MVNQTIEDVGHEVIGTMPECGVVIEQQHLFNVAGLDKGLPPEFEQSGEFCISNIQDVASGFEERRCLSWR